MTPEEINPEYVKFVEALQRFRNIGREITALREESAILRKTIPTLLTSAGLPAVAKDSPVRFLVGNTTVIIRLEKEETIIFEDFQVLPGDIS